MPDEPKDSVKKRIMARIMELLEPLKGDANFQVREILRKRSILLDEDKRPFIHVVAGDDLQISEKDNVGYLMEFPLLLKLGMDINNTFETEEDLIAVIQKQIESDIQLSGLCNFLRFEGELPYSNEATAPDGGSILHYIVQWRRKLGNPYANY